MNIIKLILPLLSVIFLSCQSDDEGQIDNLANVSIGEIPSITETDEDQTIQIPFTIDRELSTTASITVSADEYTANLGEDYSLENPSEIVFNPGETQKNLDIRIIGDDIAEDFEEFILNITNVSGLNVSLGTANVVIKDDDEEVNNDTLIIPGTGYTTPLTYPGMSLIWQDEFNDGSLNSNYWTHETGRGEWGWGNNELQYYRSQNTYFEDGNLIIEARKENISYGGTPYTSSRMITKGKFEFQYGRVDIRAALPEGQGIWPALWMLGDNIDQVSWPGCGEIDIMELVGGGIKDSEVHGTAHWKNSSNTHSFLGGDYRLSSGKFIDEFHVFSIEWEPGFIKWYMDDEPYFTFSTSSSDRTEFQNEFFFIFNVAIGGNWPGNPDASTVFPQRMIVDYIRVFQND